QAGLEFRNLHAHARGGLDSILGGHLEKGIAKKQREQRQSEQHPDDGDGPAKDLFEAMRHARKTKLQAPKLGAQRNLKGRGSISRRRPVRLTGTWSLYIGADAS